MAVCVLVQRIYSGKFLRLVLNLLLCNTLYFLVKKDAWNNKKYWKIPIVWGAVGTGVGIALWNQKNYNRYRYAFVAELNGQPHEFSNIPGVDKTVLGNAQDQYKRQRDYAIGIAGLIYILNIVDAVVDAHLFEGRKDPDLAISPTVIPDQYSVQPTKAGLSFNYRF